MLLTSDNICGHCGQPNPGHLPMCPVLGAVQPVPEETLAQTQDIEHNLGQAV